MRPTLILEVLARGKSLSMSILDYAQLSSTVRHYSQVPYRSAEIDELCTEVHSIMRRAARPLPEEDSLQRLRAAGALLWGHLLSRSAKDRLQECGGGDLLVLLDEELIGIPWELLHSGADFLCCQFNMGRSVRTSFAAPAQRYRDSRADLSMLILANPNGDLRGAYHEGLSIRNQFDRSRRDLAIDFKSTAIDTLYVKKHLRNYAIVHFAGHCDYSQLDQRQSGWVLRDGRLTPEDIRLLGEDGQMPSLIFSNACQSARVQSLFCQERVYGLAASFLLAGVRHYIGTAVRVADETSLIFARAFYEQLLKGRSIGEALRQGRLKLRHEHPSGIAWAGYLLYGDPGFCFFPPPLPQRHAVSLVAGARKKAPQALVLAAALICGVFLVSTLPTRSAGVYYRFGRLKSLYERGANAEVIRLGEGIALQEARFLPVYPLLIQSYWRLGRAEEALQTGFTYAFESQKRGDGRSQADAYTWIGWLLQQKGQYQKARDFLDQALAKARSANDAYHEAIVLRKLAVWHIDKGENDAALALLTRSSEINRDHLYSSRHRYNLACDYFDIGLVFLNKDDPRAARSFYDKSSQLFKTLNAAREMSDYYFNMGEIHLMEKQYFQALKLYQRGIRIDEAHGNLPSLAADYCMLAELYGEIGDDRSAQENFQRSIEIASGIDAPQELASAYYSFASFHRKLGRLSRYREYLRLAQELYARMDLPTYQEIKEEFLHLNEY